MYIWLYIFYTIESDINYNVEQVNNILLNAFIGTNTDVYYIQSSPTVYRKYSEIF